MHRYRRRKTDVRSERIMHTAGEREIGREAERERERE